MNIEQLHAIAQALDAELRQTNQVTLLSQLQTAITNQVNAPQDPNAQQQVADSLNSLQTALESAPSNDFPATWRQVVEEIGVSDVLGRTLYDRIAEVFARNQITPSVARDEVTEMSSQVQALATALEHLLAGLQHFGIGTEELEPGQAEVTVLIPRPVVKEELPALGEEFEELQSILGPFLELTEGSRPPLKVRTIASSDFVVYLAMIPAAALSVATALDKILDVYKKLIEVRRLRQEIADQGMTDEDLAAVDTRTNRMMADATETIANEMVDATVLDDGGRANEIKVELRLSLNALANRIDHGYNIDVRAEPETEPDEAEEEEEPTGPSETQEALLRIQDLSPNLAFINRAGRPILSLPEAADREGESTNSPSRDESSD